MKGVSKTKKLTFGVTSSIQLLRMGGVKKNPNYTKTSKLNGLIFAKMSTFLVYIN